MLESYARWKEVINIRTFGSLPAMLEAAWAHALPGREAATRNETLRAVAVRPPNRDGAFEAPGRAGLGWAGEGTALPTDRLSLPFLFGRLISVGQFRSAGGLVLLSGGALGPQMSRRSLRM